MFEKEIVCFGFRIIDMEDGSQVIDESIKTPVDALTPEMQVEYMEVHEQLAIMERMRKKEYRESKRQRKLARNPFYKFACVCGLM